MYIFKYHPDNTIYRNGEFVGSFAAFMAANPTLPLVEGAYFEYSQDEEGDVIHAINTEGHHTPVDPTIHSGLIIAILSLGE